MINPRASTAVVRLIRVRTGTILVFALLAALMFLLSELIYTTYYGFYVGSP